MRKYWKFTAIITVIVLSLATFYVNVALSKEQYPEFVMETKSGDVEEVKDLVLDASYSDRSSMSYRSPSVKITSDGSDYNSYSFIDQIIGQPPTGIKAFQEEYRNFMRGKVPSVSFFFEDNQFLAYADIEYEFGSQGASDFTFDISVLNKDNDDVNSFTVKVPKEEAMDHVFVEDVQMVGEELNIITQNMMRDVNDYYDEKHIYTIDLANQKISNHEAIMEVATATENTHVEARLIGTSPTKANENLVILKTEFTRNEKIEPGNPEEMKKEIVSYNLATKETEEISVPNLSLEENEISFFDGSTIYFTKTEEQELVVTPYHLNDKQLGQAFRVPLVNDTEFGHPPLVTVKDGKLYAAAMRMTAEVDAGVAVADVKTGETLFEGQLALKDAPEEFENFELYVQELFVK